MTQISFLALALIGLSTLALTLVSAWSWRGEKYLCEKCTFNSDNDCLNINRPLAIECRAYQEEKK